MEAAQTLPLLIAQPGTSDILDAMQVHRLRLAKAQGLSISHATLSKRITAPTSGYWVPPPQRNETFHL